MPFFLDEMFILHVQWQIHLQLRKSRSPQYVRTTISNYPHRKELGRLWCRGPTEVTLTPEEMLRLCYPNGVQGAEDSGLKPWDIALLKVSLHPIFESCLRHLQSPHKCLLFSWTCSRVVQATTYMKIGRRHLGDSFSEGLFGMWTPQTGFNSQSIRLKSIWLMCVDDVGTIGYGENKTWKRWSSSGTEPCYDDFPKPPPKKPVIPPSHTCAEWFFVLSVLRSWEPVNCMASHN